MSSLFVIQVKLFISCTKNPELNFAFKKTWNKQQYEYVIT